MKQTCILILGMHRSGTSALTGVLSIMDVYLGSELLEEDLANVKGYYENKILYSINEKILSQMGSAWDDVFFDEEKIFNVKAVDELKNQIKKEFEDSNIFAIKDPRLVFLFPVYKRILEDLNINVKVIIPFRNPIEVASSLNKRNNFCHEKGMLLWVCHLLLAERYSREFDRVFVGFNDLMASTKDSVTLISDKLHINFKSKYSKSRNLINNFLEPGLKHHNLSIDNLSENTPKIVRDILQLQNEFNDDASIRKFDELREEFFSNKKLFYNQDIVQTFIDLGVANHKLLEADQGLQRSAEELVIIKHQFSEAERGLQERIEELEVSKQEIGKSEQKQKLMLKKMEQQLEISSLKLNDVEGSLYEAKQRLYEMDQVLFQRDQEISTLRDELTAIYTGRSWKITRPLRKIKGMFK